MSSMRYDVWDTTVCCKYHTIIGVGNTLPIPFLAPKLINERVVEFIVASRVDIVRRIHANHQRSVQQVQIKPSQPSQINTGASFLLTIAMLL